jgi:hypothetical protein
MSTNDPMTQEQLDAIHARLTEVGALWKYRPTPTGDGEVITVGQEGPIAWGIDIDSAALIAHAPEDLADLLAEVERLRALTTVDDAMVERAARALNEEDETPGTLSWDNESEASRRSYRRMARAVLDAALNPGEGS